MPAAHRIVLFVAALSVAATALFALELTGRTAPFAAVVLPWPLLAAGFCVAEMKVVSVHFRRETHSFSLSEFPAVIGLSRRIYTFSTYVYQQVNSNEGLPQFGGAATLSVVSADQCGTSIFAIARNRSFV